MTIVSMIAVIVLAAGCSAPPAAPSGVDKGEHLTLAEAQGRFQLALPETAADIRFYQHLKPDQVVVADFAVSEDAFLEWAKQQGWEPKPIQGTRTMRPGLRFGEATTVLITDGYSHINIFRGEPNPFSVTFDRKTKRVYYWFSSEAPGDN